jgi:hypothetical protein
MAGAYLTNEPCQLCVFYIDKNLRNGGSSTTSCMLIPSTVTV